MTIKKQFVLTVEEMNHIDECFILLNRIRSELECSVENAREEHILLETCLNLQEISCFDCIKFERDLEERG